MTGKYMQRPQTLADVAQIARMDPLEFPEALDEFIDEVLSTLVLTSTAMLSTLDL